MGRNKILVVVAALSLLLNFIFVGRWVQRNYFAPEHTHEVLDRRVSQLELLPKRPRAIVFLGDSITREGDWSEWFPHEPVLNRGVGGDTIERVMRRLEGILTQEPRRLFLLIGINDLWRGTPVEAVLTNYKSLVDKIRSSAPRTELVLQTLLPVAPRYFSAVTNETIEKLNGGIREIAESQGLRVIDLHAQFADKEGQLPEKYTSDGIHLLGEGYLHWYKILAPYLELP